MSYLTFTTVCSKMLGKMEPEPQAPASVPKYVREGLDRQDRETLQDAIEYCEERIEYLAVQADRDLDKEQLADVTKSSLTLRTVVKGHVL